MFVKCSIGVFLCDICAVGAGPRNVVLCSPEVAGGVTAGNVVLRGLTPTSQVAGIYPASVGTPGTL